MAEPETIGGRIRARRKALGLTQDELRDRMGWTKGNQNVSNYERGHRHPRGPMLETLGAALGVSAHWLRFGDQRPEHVQEDIDWTLILRVVDLVDGFIVHQWGFDKTAIAAIRKTYRAHWCDKVFHAVKNGEEFSFESLAHLMVAEDTDGEA